MNPKSRTKLLGFILKSSAVFSFYICERFNAVFYDLRVEIEVVINFAVELYGRGRGYFNALAYYMLGVRLVHVLALNEIGHYEHGGHALGLFHYNNVELAVVGEA